MIFKLAIFKSFSVKPLSKIKIIVIFFISLICTCLTLMTHTNANNNLTNPESNAYFFTKNIDIFTKNTTEQQGNYNKNITELPFYWDFIDVEIDVEDNGDMLITETQKYIFNKEHSNQRYRYIPLSKVDNIINISVTQNNKKIPSQINKKNNQLWIKWKHQLNPPEAHTFVIKYRVIGGLQIHQNTTQVYWKAIFGDRESPIQNAKVIVRLPESLAGKITLFTPFLNHRAINIPVSSAKINSKTVEFVAQKPILQGQELEVRVTFPNNILEMKNPKWQQNQSDKSIFPRIFPIIVFIFIACRCGGSGEGSRISGAGGGGGCGGSGGGGGGGGGGG